MPGAVRGGSRVKAKPPVKAPSKAAPRTSRSAREAHGLSPRLALSGAAAILALALERHAWHRSPRRTVFIQHRRIPFDSRMADARDLACVPRRGAGRLGDGERRHRQGDGCLQGRAPARPRPRRSAPSRGKGGAGSGRHASCGCCLTDTLVVAVVERRQLAVWQHDGRQHVIDEHGQVIPEADPGRFTSLPLVVGEGGAQHAPEILPIIAQRPKLMTRMDALVRVDDRRWDLRLKDGSLIQLPASGEEDALMQLERLDQRSRILELGFDRIDLRNPDVVAVRPRQIPHLNPPPAAGGLERWKTYRC